MNGEVISPDDCKITSKKQSAAIVIEVLLAALSSYSDTKQQQLWVLAGHPIDWGLCVH